MAETPDEAAGGPSMPRSIAVLALLLALPACPQTDVGAPCNHGLLDPPRTPTVSFPALSCDELMCVYANDDEPPADPCETHAQCNSVGGERFRCEGGLCVVAATRVLERSMCSRLCEADADCEGGDPGTACESGFACARIQALGDFCCQRMCVCRDDLDLAGSRRLDDECVAGMPNGCCDRDPVPVGCEG